MPNITLPALAVASLMLAASHPAHATSFATLYHFTDKSDGGDPVGGIIVGASGTIYGETYQGGSYICPNPPYTNQGCGTVYSLSKAGGFKLLASFTGTNGGHGNITPVLVGNTLYGATAAGGASNDGVIFSVNTGGTNFTLLHQFSGTDGTEPDALVADKTGTLYGITEYGGTSNDGVLFSLSSTGTYTVLHNFTLPASGYPNALIIAPNGTLVGSSFDGGGASEACHAGCGTVFAYEPTSEKYISLFTFPGSGLDGYSPYIGSLGSGSTIYGANYANSIFSLSRSAGFTVLADLNFYTVGIDANSGPVSAPNGTLYGVLYGSVLATDGLIYRLQNGVMQDLYAFDGGLNGSGPVAKPTLTATGALLGTTEGGTCDYCGTIWEFTP